MQNIIFNVKNKHFKIKQPVKWQLLNLLRPDEQNLLNINQNSLIIEIIFCQCYINLTAIRHSKD